MEIEIKIKGDYYDDRNEMLIVAHAGELSDIIHKVLDEIRIRRKHCDEVTDKEDNFLEKLQEMLYVEWME